MTKFIQILSEDQYEGLTIFLNRANALADFATATRFDELDEATIFTFFEVLSDQLTLARRFLL